MRQVRRRTLGVLAFAAALGAPGAARADDVNITSNIVGTGLNLDLSAGTTAKVFPGVTVSNVVTPIPGGIGSTFPGIFASSRAWTLTNQGTVTASFGNGVFFKAGGTVINSGNINGSNGVWIEGGPGTVSNLSGGTIQGTSGAIVVDGVTGTVTNAGTITSSNQAVGLNGGGTLTNLAGGLIQGHGEANAVAVILGTSRTVVNSGTIQSNDTGFGTGVSLQDGTLTNNPGGKILGAYNGVWANGSNATSITNAGLIEASLAQGFGSANRGGCRRHDRQFRHHPGHHQHPRQDRCRYPVHRCRNHHQSRHHREPRRRPCDLVPGRRGSYPHPRSRLGADR